MLYNEEYTAMMDFSQMIAQLVVALLLGMLMGLERNAIGKEAGVRTNMLVSGGAAIFSMIALKLPYVVSLGAADLPAILANSTFMNIIGNIVVGVGFLGAGMIIRNQDHVHGLTTAASIWATAGIGTLVGIGLIKFAVATTIIVAGMLYLLRDFEIKKF